MNSNADHVKSMLESSLVGGLMVEKFAPREVLAETPFEYSIRLTNVSDCPVQSVVLTETLVSLMEILDSEPKSELREATMGRWVLGPIWPEDVVNVTIRCVAKKRLRFRSQTSLSYFLGSELA